MKFAPLRSPLPRERASAIVLALSLLVSSSGCSALTLMISKAVFGDAHTDNAYSAATGKTLAKGKRTVVIFVSAPTAITKDLSTLPIDLQSELTIKMKRNGVSVIDSDKVTSVLDGAGGRFDATKLAEAFPQANEFIHVVIERYSEREPLSKAMYRGRAQGIVYAYEARANKDEEPKEDKKPKRHVIRCFEREFQVEYPKTYPLSAEQVQKNVFERQFLDDLSGHIGEIFYDVPLCEAH